MKKITLVSFVLGLFWFTTTQGQTAETNLQLSNITIELNGQKVSAEPLASAFVASDTPTSVFLYKTDELSCYAEFTYKHKGNRAKLVHRNYIVLRDGSKKYSKSLKEMQELKVSVPGAFKGKASSSLLYNRAQMSNVFISYSFNYTYN